MGDTEQSSTALPFSAKDVTVFLPLAASSIAFAWEVGSFAPIGGAAFGLFSISEHLTFALQALPFALSFCIGCLAIPILLRRSAVHFQQLSVRKQWITLITATAVMIAAYSAVYFVITTKTPHPILLPIATNTMILLGFASGVAFLIGLFDRVQRPVLFLAGFLYVEIFSLVAAGDLTHQAIENDPVSHISMASSFIDLVVLRQSGTALIGYDRSTSSFWFIRSDTVKSRDWSRVTTFSN